MRHSILLDENLLAVQPKLVCMLGGIDRAIFVQQVHYWTKRTRVTVDGKRWVFRSSKEWTECFPWLSERTITRIISELVSLGILEKEQLGKQHLDRRNYLCLNYNRLEEIADRWCEEHCDQLDEGPDEECADGPRSRQVGAVDHAKLAGSITPSWLDRTRQVGAVIIEEVETPVKTPIKTPKGARGISVSKLLRRPVGPSETPPDVAIAAWERFKAAYPPRGDEMGWHEALKAFMREVYNRGTGADQIVGAADLYRRDKEQAGDSGTKFVMKPANWIVNNLDEYLAKVGTGEGPPRIDRVEAGRRALEESLGPT